MQQYLKQFANHSQYESYINGNSVALPNVSLCVQQNEVHYNPIVPPELILKFIVTDDSQPTRIYFYQEPYYDEIDATWYSNIGVDFISSLKIDGVSVDVASVDANQGMYQLSAGQHIIKYDLTNPYETISHYIPQNLFSGCTSIVEIVHIPPTITSIRLGSFAGCTNLSKVKIPNTVTRIGTSNYDAACFMNCNSLTSIGPIGSGASVELPGSVSFGYSVFSGCQNLKTVVLPEGIRMCECGLFSNCPNLTSVTFPSTTTRIADTVFDNCTGINTIICNATTAPTITQFTFQRIKPNGILKVPSGSTGYDTWMQNSQHYLGYYNWTKVEQ